jgi:hypothetical protein
MLQAWHTTEKMHYDTLSNRVAHFFIIALTSSPTPPQAWHTTEKMHYNDTLNFLFHPSPDGSTWLQAFSISQIGGAYHAGDHIALRCFACFFYTDLVQHVYYVYLVVTACMLSLANRRCVFRVLLSRSVVFLFRLAPSVLMLSLFVFSALGACKSHDQCALLYTLFTGAPDEAG